MRKFFYLLLTAGCSLLAGALSAQPDWVVNPSDFQYTMTVTSVAVVGCMESDDPNDLVGAFVDGELRGVQHLDTEVAGRQYAFMIVYDNAFIGNTITFKLYDASADTVLDALGTLEFVENSNIGGVDDPFEIRTEPAVASLALSPDTIAANAQAGETVGSLSAVNTAGDPVALSWAFVQDAQGIDNAFFAISGNTLLLNEDLAPGQNTYQVHLTGSAGSGCTVDSVLVLTVGGSMSGLAGPEPETGITVFPNPAHETLQILAPVRIDRLRIYGAAGQLVFQAEDVSAPMTVNIADWAAQWYWVSWQSGKSAGGYKLLVN